MNLVLIVNTLNLEAVRAFADKAASLQKNRVNGILAIVHQSRIPAPVIQELASPLLGMFARSVSLPVPINASLSDDGRNSTLFAVFAAQLYATAPGPWLVVDGEAVPHDEDFLTLLLKQHRALGGKASGRVSSAAGALIPIGPVVLEIPAKHLTSIGCSTAESWRSRGRHLFGRCGFKVVPVADYLFSIPGVLQKASQAPQTPVQEIPVIPPKPEPPVFNPGVLDQPDASTQEKEPDKGEVAGDPFPTGILPQPVLEVASKLVYEEMTKEDLTDLIEKRGLPKPHHFSGVDKLADILRKHDESTQASA